MTWLYVPSASALASEASTSESVSLDPTRAASLSWRGKHQPPQAWSRAWKRGGFIRLLSGLTCEPSTLASGVAQWIASCRAIPAKGTASPESDWAPAMTDGCSTAPLRSSIKAGLTPSSARTYRGISPDNLKSLSPHWSDWAAALRLEYSARPRPERAIDASGSSSWPTARASDEKGPDPLDRRPEADDDLPTRVARWPSPRTSDTNGPGMHGDGGMDLRTASVLWPTPVVKDDGKTPEGHLAMKKRMGERDGTYANRTAITSLSVYVQAFAMTDLSLPDRPTPSGEKSSETRRRLNPLFVEWLMGWPEGLSGFDTAAMESCHSPQPSPGCGCMDCWLARQREALSELLTIAPPAQGSLL